MTSVILALHLARLGLSTADVGLLFTLALLTDAALTLVLSIRADTWGRRRTLVLSGFLMTLAGVMLVVGESWWVVLLGISIGVISPGGNEVGPFLAVEQACLAQCTAAQQRTKWLAWYNVTGFVATAIGALCGGAWMKSAGSQEGASLVLWTYAMSGGAVMVLAMLLTRKVEIMSGQNTPRAKPHWTGLGESRSKVARLGGLFSLDSFAGGFIPQSLLAYWFATRWSLNEWELGQVFFATSLLSGISGLMAASLSQKIGMVNTMVFTHLPSNVLLMLVPVMPSAGLAISCLLLRHCLSQMDVPVRQSYVMCLVRPEERSAANGIIATVRSLSAALSPMLAGVLLSPTAWLSGPLVIAGGLKSLYDVLLFRTFRSVQTEEKD